MFRRLSSIAKITLLEFVRNKTSYVFLFFAIIFIFVSYGMGMLSMGEYIRVAQNTGLFFISLLSMLFVIFGIQNITIRDFYRKSIYTILSKLNNRYEYVLGRFLGLTLSVIILISVMSALFLPAITLFNFMMFAKSDIHYGVLVFALFMTMLEMIMLISLAMLFSNLLSSVLASIITFFIFIIGNSSGVLKIMSGKTPLVLKYLLLFFYYVLPNFENFNFRNMAIYGIMPSIVHIIDVVIYFMLYTGIILYLTSIVFEKKDM